MPLQITNHKDNPCILAVIDADTGKEIAYSKLTLHTDCLKGYAIRATIDLPIGRVVPLLDGPVDVDADLRIEIGGKMYRVTPTDD